MLLLCEGIGTILLFYLTAGCCYLGGVLDPFTACFCSLFSFHGKEGKLAF